MHYDIGTLSLWIGVGVALILGAIQAAGWRHRLLISSLIALGGVCIVAALAGPLVSGVWPSLDRFMTQAAANPSSWFALFLFAAALVIFTGPQFRKSNTKADASDEAWSFKAGTKVRNESVTDLIESRLDAIERVTNELTKRQLAHVSTPELRASLEVEIETLRVGLNGLHTALDTDKAALNALEDAHLTQISRVTGDVQKLESNLLLADEDLKGLLDLGASLVDVAFLDEIIAAHRPVEGGWSKEAEDQVRDFISTVEMRLLGTNRAGSFSAIMKNAEKEIDKVLLEKPQDQYPGNLNPGSYRKWLIITLQAEWLQEWLLKEKRGREEYIRSLRPELFKLLAQRFSKTYEVR